MKRLRVLLSTGLDASLSQDTQHEVTGSSPTEKEAEWPDEDRPD